MKAVITPQKLKGEISAPPSKSMAHRLLIGAAVSGEICTISGVDFSEDILATIDCLRGMGASVTVENDAVTVNPSEFMKIKAPRLESRESGSTLRFLIPLALCLGEPVCFCGARRLFERPLSVYEELAKSHGFLFEKGSNSLTVSGKLSGGKYKIPGGISSQFISGLIFALVYLGEKSEIEITPPFESRPYVDLTIDALKSFGADVSYRNSYEIEIKPALLHGFSGKVEGDYSNAAFLDAFNLLGSEIKINNLSESSLQGDKIYKEYFEAIEKSAPTLDVSKCPDLAPVLIALAALKNGATLTGTDRLKLKESDRGAAMHEELVKLSGGLVFGENEIIVPKQSLSSPAKALDGHGDHRIVMALSVILSEIGGEIEGAEAVRKSYPGFFDDLKALSGKVELL